MALYAGLGAFLPLCAIRWAYFFYIDAYRCRPSILLLPAQSHIYVSMAVGDLLDTHHSIHFSLIGLFASFKFFKAALGHVLRSPMSFFDTTPMGMYPFLLHHTLRLYKHDVE